MKNKKRGFYVIIFFIFTILLISMISAGLSDFVKSITGKATRRVSLTVQGNPEIVFISDINGALLDTGVPVGSRDLTAGTTTPIIFEFYVWHTGGVSALPTGGAVTDNNALITLRDINLPNDERKSSDAAPATTCIHIRDSNCPVGSVSHVGENCRVYSCTVAMQYWDDYGSAISMNWEVKAMIQDIFGNEDSETTPNSNPQPIRRTYFNALSTSELVGADLSFGTVNYGPQTTQPADVLDTYPLSVKNTGNVDISSTEITAYNIPDIIDGNEFILSSWFKSDDEASVCTLGNSLADSNPIDSGLPLIAHAQDAESDLRICLTDVQLTAPPQDYSTQLGTDWDININQ